MILAFWVPTCFVPALLLGFNAILRWKLARRPSTGTDIVLTLIGIDVGVAWAFAEDVTREYLVSAGLNITVPLTFVVVSLFLWAGSFAIGEGRLAIMESPTGDKIGVEDVGFLRLAAANVLAGMLVAAHLIVLMNLQFAPPA